MTAFSVDSIENISQLHSVVVVSVKAFGDLVIAIHCCERAQQQSQKQIMLLIGNHLVPLYHALKTPLPYRAVSHADTGMPALFEVRKAGFFAAAKSARTLRRHISDAGLPPDAKLLFDRRNFREAYITKGRAFEIIPAANNIYLAYDKWFGTGDAAPKSLNRAIGPIRIFPGSRMPAKNLPLPLIGEISDVARSLGLTAELMVLDGERPDIEASGLNHIKIPRQFSAMIDAVCGAGSVVSADSLPAHIAELVGRSAFVFSPVSNRYWLPKTSYMNQWDGLFGEGGRTLAFAAFINRVSRSAL